MARYVSSTALTTYRSRRFFYIVFILQGKKRYVYMERISAGYMSSIVFILQLEYISEYILANILQVKLVIQIIVSVCLQNGQHNESGGLLNGQWICIVNCGLTFGT